MPIYEYKCRTCGATFEKLVSTATTAITCEQCGSRQVEKQFSTFSASVASSSPAPCSTGGCPTDGMAGTGCSGGGCPYS